MSKSKIPRRELINKLLDRLEQQSNTTIRTFFNNQSDKILFELCKNDGILKTTDKIQETREKVKQEQKIQGKKSVKISIQDIVKLLIDSMNYFELPKEIKCIDLNGWERFDMLTCKIRVNQFNDIQQWTNMNVYFFLFVIKRLQKFYQDESIETDFYTFLKQNGILLHELTVNKLVKLLCLLDYKFIFSQNQVSWQDISKYAKEINEYLQTHKYEALILMQGPTAREAEKLKNLKVM